MPGYDRELISNGNPMEAVVGFSRALRMGPYITIGGTASVGADGKTVRIGDIATQTRQCLKDHDMFDFMQTIWEAPGPEEIARLSSLRIVN